MEGLFLPVPGSVWTTKPDGNKMHRTSCAAMKLDFTFARDVARLDAKVVEVALRRAAAQNRRLCCGVEWIEKEGDISRSSLLQLADKASQLELNFRYFETDSESEAVSLAENLASREKNTPYAYFVHETHKPLLLWRASAVYFKGEAKAETKARREGVSDAAEEKWPKLSMIIGVNHVLGDGMSIAVFTKHFSDALDMLLELRKYAPVEVLNEARIWDLKVSRTEASYSKLPTAYVHFLGILSFIYVSVYNAYRGFFERQRGDDKKYHRQVRAELPAPDDPLPTPSVAMGYFLDSLGKTTISSRFELTKEQTANLRNNSRKNGTTVAGALLASAALAYRKTLPAEERERWRSLSWACTVSNRTYLPKEEWLEFGNFSNTVIVKYQKLRFPEAKMDSDVPEMWKVAKRLLDVTKKHYVLANHSTGVMIPLFLSFPYSWQNSMVRKDGKPNSRKTHAFEMTNLGNAVQKLFDEDINLKNVRVSSVEGGLNRDSYGGVYDFGVIVATHDGVLRCNIDFESAFFSQQEANAIAADMREYLSWLASTSSEQTGR